jgi:hypothetical protein
MPLEKLGLAVTDLATDRAEYIGHLDRGTRRSVGLSYYGAGARRDRLLTRISEVLLGMRAPEAASTNWPSIVHLPDKCYNPLLAKCRDPNEGGICHYRKEKRR